MDFVISKLNGWIIDIAVSKQYQIASELKQWFYKIETNYHQSGYSEYFTYMCSVRLHAMGNKFVYWKS